MLDVIPFFGSRIRTKIKEEDQEEVEFAKINRSLEDGLFNQNEPGTLATPNWLRRALWKASATSRFRSSSLLSPLVSLTTIAWPPSGSAQLPSWPSQRAPAMQHFK
jgi:hypothetical protein